MSPGHTMFEVDRVVSVKVRSSRDSPGVARPDRHSGVIRRKPERVTVLTQPIKIGVGRKTCFDTKVLRLEDEREAGSGEKNLLSRLSVDGERER